MKTQGKVFFWILLTTIFYTNPASAQELEEIVVTAQKREQSIQEIAFTVNAFTAEDLRVLRVTEIYDVAQLVPGVDIKPGIGGHNPFITIRGVGLNDFSASSTGSVGVYLDEVFLSSVTSLEFTYFDTERVEVLKGPQGTLYGRNVTGGAINILSRKPTEEFDAYISAGVGNFELAEVEAAVGGPFTDGWAGRLSGKYRYQGEAYQDNRFTLGGPLQNPGDINEYAVRGQLRFIGREGLDVNLKLEYYELDGVAFQNKLTGILDPATTAAILAAEGGVGFPSLGPLLAIPPGVLGIGAACASYFTGNPTTATCVGADGTSDTNPDVWETVGNFRFGHFAENETFMAALKIDWDVEFADLTSVTGYGNVERRFEEDGDVSVFNLFDALHDNEIEQFSQELRLHGQSDRLDWIAGFFYSFDNAKVNTIENVRDILLTDIFIEVDQDTESWAVFADGDYKLSDRWILEGGIRFTHEKKDYVGGTRDLDPEGVDFFLVGAGNFITFADDSISEDDVSGTVALKFLPNDNWMWYLRWSSAFKSGGWTGDLTFSDVELDPYKPEDINAFEGGFKADLTDNFRLNVAGFYYDYKNIQTFVTGTVSLTLANVDSADVYGVDIDAAWQATDRLLFTGGFSWLDTELADFDNTDQVTGALITFMNNELPNAPEITFNGLARYEFPIGDFRAAIQTDFSYKDDMFRDANNNIQGVTESYWLLNARLSATSADERWEVAVWGKNITEEEYFQNQLVIPFLGGVLQTPNYPRTWGATVTYRWQ